MFKEWQTIVVPLDYAVQSVTDVYGGTGTTRKTVTSGNVTYGTEVRNGDPSRYIYSHSVKLYFKNIPHIENCYWQNFYIDYFDSGNEIITEETRWTYFSELNSWNTVKFTSKNTYDGMSSYLYSGYDYTDTDHVISGNSLGKATTPITQDVINSISNNGYKIRNDVYGEYKYATTTKETYKLSKITDVSKVCLVIKYQPVPVKVELLFPIDVYVKNNKQLDFEWTSELQLLVNNRPDIQKKDSSVIYLASNKLEVWNDSNYSKTYNLGGNVQKYTMSASDVSSFGIGNVYYKVTATCSNGEYDSLQSGFVILGQSAAPDIVSVSQDSFPVVTWTCQNQISWQMVIKRAEEVLYDSGMVAGTNKSYKVPVLLDNGVYSIEMRALNNYGYYTPWNASTFTLNPTAPTAPTNIIVSANNDYSVFINCSAPANAGTLYVVRRETSEGNGEIIGEWYKGFKDVNVALNKTYEYTVRNYNVGYADGDWRDVTINSPGVIIREASNTSNYIKVWMNDSDFDVMKKEEKSDTLMQCIGRTYPVLELGEWVTSTRSFNGCITESDLEKLVNIIRTNAGVILQNNGEVFRCYLQISDNGKHQSGYRNVNFVLTRIDGE